MNPQQPNGMEITPKQTVNPIEIQNLSTGVNNNSLSGRWTSEEHDRFMEGINKFGMDWRAISEHVGTRTLIQVGFWYFSQTKVRSHAQKYFAKIKKNQSANILPSIESASDRKPIYTIVNEQQKSDTGSTNQSSSFPPPLIRSYSDSFSRCILDVLRNRQQIINEIGKRESIEKSSQLGGCDVSIYNMLSRSFLSTTTEAQQINSEVSTWVLHAIEKQPSAISNKVRTLILTTFPNLRSSEIIPFNRLDTVENDVTALEQKYKEVCIVGFTEL